MGNQTLLEHIFKEYEMTKTKETEHKVDCATNAAEICDEFAAMGCTCKGQNIKIWCVKRYIVEEYQVEGKTKEEALENVENPYKIKILKETIKRLYGFR